MFSQSSTYVGNLTGDPELRFTPSGHAVANFSIAVRRSHFDKGTSAWVDDDPLYVRCTVWRAVAEHAVASLAKGDRVIVVGETRQREYTTPEGAKRTAYDFDVAELGASVTFSELRVLRTARPVGEWVASAAADPVEPDLVGAPPF